MNRRNAIPLTVLMLAMVLFLCPGRNCAAQETRSSPAASTRPARKTRRPADGRASQPGATTQATQPGAESLSQCRALFMKGRYPAAADGYRKLMSQEALRVSAAIGMSDALMMTGKYADALKTLQSVADEAAANPRWRLALAEALAVVGRYTEALRHATSANELLPIWAPAILMRGQLLETLGRRDEAVGVYKTMQKVVAGEDYLTDARSLVALGWILDRYSVRSGKRASEYAPNILHNYFQRAYQQVDEKYWPANLSTGMFLLARHKRKLAATEFKLASRINRNIPAVHVGAGSIALSQWQFERCVKAVDAALKINPNFADALLLKGACMMQWRKFDRVAPILEKILSVNPNHLDALSLMAALHVRLNRPEQAQGFIRRVEEVNLAYAGLWNTMGQWLCAARQFDQARKHYLRAIDLDDRDGEPLTNLGLLYMQTGDEAKAREILDRAFRIDNYRADVRNYLGILKKLEKFSVRETEHFIIKVDGRHDSVLLDSLAEYAEAIYHEVCGHFEHHPSVKTMVEVFPTHPQFSVRITGKGWIGTVGACTGRVIVLVAPNKERSRFGTYNLPVVLRHEFTHTVTLSATKNRIPHWFTEACAVWEQPDPRNYEAVSRLVRATRTGTLFPIRELDWGFIRPRRGGDRSLAYAQAEWMMEYIIAKKGFGTIIKMLDGFGDGLSQAEVFRKVVRTTEKQFDKDFRAWAKTQVRQWGFDADPAPDLKKAAARAKANPEDAAVQATLAVALMARRRTADAEKAARKALELDDANADALDVLARVLLARKKYDQAIEAADRLEQADHTSVTAPRVLASCHLKRRNWAKAIAALELFKRRRHLDPYACKELAKIYIQLGQPEKALPNLIELHRRTMKDPVYARQIAGIYKTVGRHDSALEYYGQVTQINPYEVSAYRAMATIHLNARRYGDAAASAGAVCAVDPKSSDAWTFMGMVRYRAGKAQKDKDQLLQAKQDVEKALKLDPESRDARQVLKVIDAELTRQAIKDRGSRIKDRD